MVPVLVRDKERRDSDDTLCDEEAAPAPPLLVVGPVTNNPFGNEYDDEPDLP